ncbi:SDR family NAD(P)-dependent oxidoreductase [Corynebacterium liangguodongii]|uniref:3-hydroxyacyl-CoA dehydrogenase n=1 Tax=Corynebacterium liangguodongii TaxID=2079535 RepID=A0A2S0WDG3_9CORY|nr:SDR family NAD(P)-dependent oxidoreductase [Corynebacterium liangguodongii]AWB83712.1 3-hydroxyacyl-CoA dehydrogenase [Corynebacterium liangguodongii]PWB99478.1 3-hydroxyacyl-CoA dehydrogenase [Corynebacterium liangguodongii]
MELTNTAAVVTGAASGLGRATAEFLVARGVRVTGFDLQEPADSVGFTSVVVDVTDPEAVSAAVADAAAEAPLRVAVNCAGIAPSARILGRKGPHDPGLFSKVIDVNLRGTFHVLTAAAAEMATTEPLDADGQRGVIINTASVAAFEGQVGQAAYSASKGAVHALSITAARDLASLGIRVNAIAPGIVETPMMSQITPEFRAELEANVQFPSRLARPEEFASLVVSIIDNDYLNGQTIRLDGALRMPPR